MNLNYYNQLDKVGVIVKRGNLKIFVFYVCIFVVVIVFYLFHSGTIVFDHSAQWRGQDIYWNDCIYIPCTGEYHEGKTVAKTSDGWQINGVKEDNSHTFIVVRSFLDQYLYVRKDYKIPTYGKVSAIYWNGNKITDDMFCQTVSDIAMKAESSFEYETEGIYMLTATQHLRSLYFCYEDCPIGTDFIGYMGTISDQWIITTYISTDQRNSDGSPKPYTISCSIIPDDMIEILLPYFE